MAVLNTTSPTATPDAPMARPRNTVPSASARSAGVTAGNSGAEGSAWASGGFILDAMDLCDARDPTAGLAGSARAFGERLTCKRGRFPFPASDPTNYTANRTLHQ